MEKPKTKPSITVFLVWIACLCAACGDDEPDPRAGGIRLSLSLDTAIWAVSVKTVPQYTLGGDRLAEPRIISADSALVRISLSRDTAITEQALAELGYYFDRERFLSGKEEKESASAKNASLLSSMFGIGWPAMLVLSVVVALLIALFFWAVRRKSDQELPFGKQENVH